MTKYVVKGELGEIVFDEPDLDAARYRAINCLNWTKEPIFAYGDIDTKHGGEDTLLTVGVFERTDDQDVCLGNIYVTGPDLCAAWEYADVEGDWIEIDPDTGELFKVYEVTITRRAAYETASPSQARTEALERLKEYIVNGWTNNDTFEIEVKMVNDNQKSRNGE